MSTGLQQDELRVGELSRRLRCWFGWLAAVVAIGTGALVLVGWATGIEALKRIEPNLVAMNPVTAACLVLIGAAIACHCQRRARLAAAIGLAVAGIAFAKLIDLAVGGLPVDQLLFAAHLDGDHAGRPNRIAPNTSVALLFLGAALALLASRRRGLHLLAQALALLVMLVSMFAVIGYIFGLDPLTTVGPFIPMALHTAFALLVASAGVVSLGRDTPITLVLGDRGPAGSLARVVFPLAVLIPVAIGFVRLWGQKQGFYGVEAGAALTAVTNVLVTSLLLIASMIALHRSDRERKEREDALRRSEHFNRTINEASPDCVSLLDLAGNVIFANDATVRAYGLTSDSELLGRPWGERLDTRIRAQAQSALAEARAGGVGRLLIGVPGRSGEKRWFESLVSTLADVDGQPISFIVMSRDITEQKAIEDEVRWAATHDALTGLPNRALFQARLDQICGSAGQPHFALLLLDVDHFKLVNDTLGHGAGDALLQALARRLGRSVRKQDFVARLGGDEFAVILNDVREEAVLHATATKIVETLKEPWLYEGHMFDCRVSIGASIALKPREDASEILKRADVALYAAKQRGRERIAVYEPNMRADMQKRASEMSLARDALANDLIRPSYQPKVDLKTGKLVGFEALLRWRHPVRGIQEPALLGAAFQDLELARALTDRMLTHVLRDARRWINDGVEFGHVAINAAPADFKQKGFAERLLKRLQRAGVPPHRVQVEVTETVFLGRGAEYVETALKTLSAAGIRIALDDFGTGYASLSHLKQFPVDVMKIDQSFLRDIKDPHNGAIIRTVVSLGASLGLDVVAEGVETPEQEAYLIAEGCRFGQGFLYGKAAPAAQVPELVKAGARRIVLAA